MTTPTDPPDPVTAPAPRTSLLILLTALLLLVPVELVARAVVDDAAPTDRVVDNLLAPPREGGVWLLGNSIFKTGVDPEALETQLDGPPVDFEYHGGHYTSLWYLIATNAMPDLDPQPGIVVWGFRPGYASLPAFRQNVVNDTEQFLAAGDPVYDELAEGISPPSRNPLDELAADIDDAAADSGLYRLRDDVQTGVLDTSVELGAALASAIGASGGELVRDEVVDGDAALLDVLNDAVTGGAVQLAEERVVDGVGDFIEGERTDYAGSFVPVIADRIADLGIDQLVVIWPPVKVAEGSPDPLEDAFVADALADLGAAGIPVLDLYHDPAITLDLFASGDHFNPDGRDLVTRMLADALRELGYGSPA